MALTGGSMNIDHEPYFKFTRKARLDKSINSLLGLIEGITIDQVINPLEIKFLDAWLEDHHPLREKHPFNELISKVELSLADKVLTQDEHQDIVWLCNKLTSNEYYNRVTTDIQKLHAVIGGVVADTKISEIELRGLAGWIDENDHLRGCLPYDEIDSLITSVLADQQIDANEHTILADFFSGFVALLDDRVIDSPPVETNGNIIGLCAVCPEIKFQDHVFCFTGASSQYPRAQLKKIIESHGGQFAAAPSKKVDYLIIGADGNPCWAYACYGRKVEKAVELRKAGVRLMIVHESDFHDAILDNS